MSEKSLALVRLFLCNKVALIEELTAIKVKSLMLSYQNMKNKYLTLILITVVLSCLATHLYGILGYAEWDLTAWYKKWLEADKVFGFPLISNCEIKTLNFLPRTPFVVICIESIRPFLQVFLFNLLLNTNENGLNTWQSNPLKSTLSVFIGFFFLYIVVYHLGLIPYLGSGPNTICPKGAEDVSFQNCNVPYLLYLPYSLFTLGFSTYIFLKYAFINCPPEQTNHSEIAILRNLCICTLFTIVMILFEICFSNSSELTKAFSVGVYILLLISLIIKLLHTISWKDMLNLIKAWKK